MTRPDPVTAEEAAKALDVPTSLIASWKHRERVMPVEIRDIHQRGTRHVPMYSLDELRPLADEWRRRRAARS